MRNMLPSYVKYKMPGQIPWYVDIYFIDQCLEGLHLML